MTLRSITHKLLPVVVYGLLAAACSNIGEDERLIYVKPADVKRSVLIEDFTGQNCLNCPDATDEIELIAAQYGDAVVAVGIHSGPLGFAGNDRYVGLMTDTGNEYYNYWSIEYQPMGVINRSSGALQYTQWAAAVRSELEKEATVSIEVANVYDSADRSAGISVTSMSIEGAFSGKLQVWMVEDSISAYQRIQDGTYNYDYVHNHVFRVAVNGTWGEDISLSEGSPAVSSYVFTLPETWNAANVSVVAFLYDESGVQQVVRTAVIE